MRHTEKMYLVESCVVFWCRSCCTIVPSFHCIPGFSQQIPITVTVDLLNLIYQYKYNIYIYIGLMKAKTGCLIAGAVVLTLSVIARALISWSHVYWSLGAVLILVKKFVYNCVVYLYNWNLDGFCLRPFSCWCESAMHKWPNSLGPL